MSEMIPELNLSLKIDQPKTNRCNPSNTQRHKEMVEGYNDVNQMSNFDCEWIDHQESPNRAVNQSFPSDIEIGIDGVNVASNQHLQMNSSGFYDQNDVSLNNEDDSGFLQKSNNLQLQERSYLSTDSHPRQQNIKILGDDLELLNNSRQIQFGRDPFEKHPSSNNDFFDGQNNLISQIQPSEDYNEQVSDYKYQEDVSENNQHNQNPKDKRSEQQDSYNLQVRSFHTKEHVNQNPLNHQHKLSSDVIEGHSNLKQQHSLSSTEKQSTIVINQQSFLSKIYEDISNSDQSKLLKSMAHYIETNNKSYRPYYTLLQTLFNNSKLKSDKSIENFNMYSDFFRQKTKQLQKYLREAQSQKTQKLFQNLKTKQINNLVYVDTKIVLRDIHEKNIKKVKLERLFYKQLQQISTQFKKMISEVYERRHTLEKQISTVLSLIKSVENQLEKMIEYRVNYETMKNDPEFNIEAKQLFKVDNPHVAKDQYLQIKVIIQKEAFYISKLKQLRVEVIKYITLVFLTDQIMISAKIKQNLINYTDLLIQIEKIQKNSNLNTTEENSNQNSQLQMVQRKKNSLNQKKIHQELKLQLTKRLLQSIPEILKSQIGLSDQQTEINSQELLQELNSHFQNQVFFPSIELEDQFQFYTTQATWISRDQYQKAQESKNGSNIQQKEKNDQIQQAMNLRLVLSVNKYLHMEQNQKIATLKLNQIKISKKGKYIIISDRGKGIVGFLVNSGNQLGRIKFKSSEQSDKFAQKIRQLVQQK